MKEQSKKDQEMLRKADELYTKLTRLRGRTNNKGTNSLLTNVRIHSVKRRLLKVDSYFRKRIAELKDEAQQKSRDTGVIIFDPRTPHFEFLFQQFEYLKGNASLTRLCTRLRIAANESKHPTLTSSQIEELHNYAISKGFMNFSVRNLNPDISFEAAKNHIDRFVELAEDAYVSALKAGII